MPFPLSFSSHFFSREAVEDITPSSRPASVCQAIASMSEETWAEMAREIFGCEPAYVSVETVLDRVLETNTCRDLTPPVEVYIDPEGYYSVLVYDD